MSLLLPAGQYHQPDPELRIARADRRAGGRPRRRQANYDVAQELGDQVSPDSRRGRRAHPPGGGRYPRSALNVDRSKAVQLGLTQRDVTNSMLISLSSQRPGSPQSLAESGRTASTTASACRPRSTAWIRSMPCFARRFRAPMPRSTPHARFAAARQPRAILS